MARRTAILVAMMLVLTAAVPPAGGDSITEAAANIDLPNVPPLQIDDPTSDAEMEDLAFLAEQEGMPIEAVINRYAWNDNFAIAVAAMRQSSPEAFTGAAITGSGSAWVAFAGSAPREAVETMTAFEVAHEAVAVDVLVDQGFTERDLERTIEAVHYSVFEAAGVRDATTSFDFESRRITVLVGREAGSSVDDLRAAAIDRLNEEGLGEILDSISLSLVVSALSALGGSDDNTKAIGGEDINLCTSGFSVRDGGIGGISTAGHCDNPQSDEGINWTYQAGHEGAHGDFQWHTTPQLELDDFYPATPTRSR